MNIKSYVINIDDRKDRRGSMENELLKLKTVSKNHNSKNTERTFNFSFEIISAITPKNHNVPQLNFDTPAKVAAIKSHIKALERAYKTHDRYAIIMEDDIILCEDFTSRLRRIISRLPDDISVLYLGQFKPDHTEYPSAETDSTNQFIRLACGNILGAFCYMVNIRFIPVILEHCRDYHHCYDNMLAELQRSYKMAYTIPFLCYVKDDYSDLSRANVSYPGIKNGFVNKLSDKAIYHLIK